MRNDIRDSLIKYCERQFGAEPARNEKYEEPNIIIKHRSTGKEYAIFFEAPVNKIRGYNAFSLPTVNILVVRCSEEKIQELLERRGFFEAYKRNSKMWITVLLSGFIDKEKYINLLRNAFELTDDPKHSELDFLTDTRQDKSKRFSEAYKDAPIDFSKVKSRRKRAELEKIKAGIKKSSDNLKNQSKEEKEKINIDFDSLQNIRSDAAVTMEKLLTEEQLDGDKPMPEMSLQEEESKQDAIDADMFFTGHEIYFFFFFLNGKEYKKYFSSNHIKLSMLIDSINEKMMDTTGDTVIEFNGDEPELIVDYIEDIKEKL